MYLCLFQQADILNIYFVKLYMIKIILVQEFWKGFIWLNIIQFLNISVNVIRPKIYWRMYIRNYNFMFFLWRHFTFIFKERYINYLCFSVGCHVVVPLVAPSKVPAQVPLLDQLWNLEFMPFSRGFTVGCHGMKQPIYSQNMEQ